MRMLIAAIVMLVLIRPKLTGRSKGEWLGIVVYGLAMAAMNICLYSAIDRIPMGVAVTLEFLGPCVVALAGSRHWREGLCAVVALAGVGLISFTPGGYFTTSFMSATHAACWIACALALAFALLCWITLPKHDSGNLPQ